MRNLVRVLRAECYRTQTCQKWDSKWDSSDDEGGAGGPSC